MNRLDRIEAQLPEYRRWIASPSPDDLRLLIDAARLFTLNVGMCSDGTCDSKVCVTKRALLAEEPS